MSVTMQFPCYGGGPDCPSALEAVFTGGEPALLPCTHCAWHTHTIEAETKEECHGLMRAYVNYLSQRKRLSRELDALLKGVPAKEAP